MLRLDRKRCSFSILSFRVYTRFKVNLPQVEACIHSVFRYQFKKQIENFSSFVVDRGFVVVPGSEKYTEPTFDDKALKNMATLRSRKEVIIHPHPHTLKPYVYPHLAAPFKGSRRRSREEVFSAKSKAIKKHTRYNDAYYKPKSYKKVVSEFSKVLLN